MFRNNLQPRHPKQTLLSLLGPIKATAVSIVMRHLQPRPPKFQEANCDTAGKLTGPTLNRSIPSRPAASITFINWDAPLGRHPPAHGCSMLLRKSPSPAKLPEVNMPSHIRSAIGRLSRNDHNKHPAHKCISAKTTAHVPVCANMLNHVPSA